MPNLFCYYRRGLLRRRANARNVSDTPNHTDEKHTISTLVDQNRIQLTLSLRKKTQFFSKLVFQLLLSSLFFV